MLRSDTLVCEMARMAARCEVPGVTFWQNASQGWIGSLLGALIGAAIGAGAAIWVLRRSLEHAERESSQAAARQLAMLQQERLLDAVLAAFEEVADLEDRVTLRRAEAPLFATYGNTIAVTKAVALARRAGLADLDVALMGGRALAGRGLQTVSMANGDSAAIEAGWAQAWRGLMGLRVQLEGWLIKGVVPPLPAGARLPGD